MFNIKWRWCLCVLSNVDSVKQFEGPMAFEQNANIFTCISDRAEAEPVSWVCVCTCINTRRIVWAGHCLTHVPQSLTAGAFPRGRAHTVYRGTRARHTES